METVELARTDICDKHAQMKKFKTKKTFKSMDDLWYHNAYGWARPCTRQGYTK